MNIQAKLVVAFAILCLLGACDSPRFVARVEIANRTAYPAGVKVRGSTGGWLNLTTVRAGATEEVREVLDQGPSWTFRFGYSDVAVEVTVDREALADANWRVEVPEELEERLRDQGVSVPP